MLASIACARTGKKNAGRKQRYYVCSGKFNKVQSAPEEKCPSRYAPAEQLDEIVWKDLCEVLTHPESITEALRRAYGGRWLPPELKARRENLRQGRGAPPTSAVAPHPVALYSPDFREDPFSEVGERGGAPLQ